MATTTDTPITEPAQGKVITPTRKKRAMRAYLLLGGLAVAVLAIYFIHGYLTKDEVSTDDAQIDADVVPLAARIGGVILRIDVEDHQRVKAGQLLAEIDPADYDENVKAAEDDLDAAGEQAAAADAQVQIVKATSTGGLSSARAQLQGTSASVRAAASQIQAASAAVARAKSDLAKAERDLTRAKTLHDQGAITGQALESAQASRDSTAAAYDLANANLNSARDQQQLSQTRVAEAQGHVEQSGPIDQQNAVAFANSKLAHSRVHRAQDTLPRSALSDTRRSPHRWMAMSRRSPSTPVRWSNRESRSRWSSRSRPTSSPTSRRPRSRASGQVTRSRSRSTPPPEPSMARS